jgi:hypothetical protein
MPRRKNADGDAATANNNTGAQPAKQPRVRKKKEPASSICTTPTGDHPPPGMLKLEAQQAMGGMPPGCGGPGGPMDGPMPHGMLGGPPPGMHMQHHHHPGLPNGIGGGGPHHQMMEDGSNGPGGMGPAFGAGPPQVCLNLPQPHPPLIDLSLFSSFG